jgi:hypothetical protein
MAHQFVLVLRLAFSTKAEATMLCITYAVFHIWKLTMYCFTIHASFHGTLILTEIASKWFNLNGHFKNYKSAWPQCCTQCKSIAGTMLSWKSFIYLTLFCSKLSQIFLIRCANWVSPATLTVIASKLIEFEW